MSRKSHNLSHAISSCSSNHGVSVDVVNSFIHYEMTLTLAGQNIDLETERETERVHVHILCQNITIVYERCIGRLAAMRADSGKEAGVGRHKNVLA